MMHYNNDDALQQWWRPFLIGRRPMKLATTHLTTHLTVILLKFVSLSLLHMYVLITITHIPSICTFALKSMHVI